ncbi:septum formation family protein [Nocardioides sp. Soil805]|uniref:septum formation family protein n=1 Tax=Nocardioides sp. Soil805 TaxID=1736416 RepID=UPI000A7A4C56|nr:septum formation family protein [Nocardioides sp. Soil805]
MAHRGPGVAALVAALLLAGAALAGCTDDAGSPEPASPSTSASPSESAPTSPSPSAVVSPERPDKDGCHLLTYDEAIAPVVAGTEVPCRQRHTAQTFRIGRLDLVADGHLRAVDSPDVQADVARTCTSSLGDHVGGTLEDRRLSMVQAVWFTPSVEDAAAGADWFRCDVVALASAGQLLPLPRSTRGLVGSSDRLAMCSTAEPGTGAFERVPCGVGDHAWRAISTVDLPGSAYPSAGEAGSRMESACRSAARAQADDPLDFTWSEERPTQVQWDAGQHYGICWVPD